MRRISFGWLWRRQKRWMHLQQVPMRQLSVFLTAVFLLFSVIGFYADLMNGGTEPYAIVLVTAILSGLNAVLWVVVVSRLPIVFMGVLIAKELFLPVNHYVTHWVRLLLDPSMVAPATGLHFAGTSILVVVIASYACFSAYIGIAGREAFRIRNELALAHSIQKTLVPPIGRTLRCFDVYGISHPSEKVGGDLVDVVDLPGGDTVAYLADIAGHGLQAGILMGMLKTAARTALTDGAAADGAVLSQLMERLNVVLPQVKEAHMYATFTALRLNRNGQAFYGMAASPPLLHWSAPRKAVLRTEEEQFPLGLLPIAHFPTGILQLEAGDIVLVATDGILEVCSREKSTSEVEFGVAALGALLSVNAELSLAELATLILNTVRSYGKQLDDQTLLLVRRRTDAASFPKMG